MPALGALACADGCVGCTHLRSTGRHQLVGSTQAPASLLLCLLQVEAFLFGSVPLRAVLPDGDIDISVFTTAPAGGAGSGSSSSGSSAAGGSSLPGPPPVELRDTWASQLLRALEREASRPDAPFKIRDVQIIQAEARAAWALFLLCHLACVVTVVTRVLGAAETACRFCFWFGLTVIWLHAALVLCCMCGQESLTHCGPDGYG